MKVAAASCVLAVAVAAAPVGPTAATRQQAGRVVDGTFACAPALVGGVRQIDATARKGSLRHQGAWDSPALASVSTSVSASIFTAIENELVWVVGGPPSAGATVASTVFRVRSWGTLGVNAKLCRRSAERVPLGRSGLRGGAAGPFEERWDCATGRRVLVRLRAVFGSRAAMKSYRGFLRTTVPVETASLAVRTNRGKPLVYAEVLESGKASLFTAPSCFPD